MRINNLLRIVQSPIKTETMNPFAKPAHFFTICLTATTAHGSLNTFRYLDGDTRGPLALTLHTI
jgi:hypothetical protein